VTAPLEHLTVVSSGSLYSDDSDGVEDDGVGETGHNDWLNNIPGLSDLVRSGLSILAVSRKQMDILSRLHLDVSFDPSHAIDPFLALTLGLDGHSDNDTSPKASDHTASSAEVESPSRALVFRHARKGCSA
jgi:hypothetical protein